MQNRSHETASSKALLEKLNVAGQNASACTGVDNWIESSQGEAIVSWNPSTGEKIGGVRPATRETYDNVVVTAQESFEQWRQKPAPSRGQLVRDLGNELRRLLEPLGELVTLETGKIRTEGIGEVQEMIDICDFAVGLSRQLCGSTMHSERPGHRMYEQWHPLGPIGIISAFNFPVAVWSWNAALACVCGDTMIWKPSPMAPFCSIAVQDICNRVMADHGVSGVFNLVIGTNQEIAEPMVEDKRLPLISFTGSCQVGRKVASVVGARLGRSLLELGGNNAVIVEPDANLELAVKGILFGAVGTAGQRCTTTRRLIAHNSIVDQLQEQLASAYGNVKIGDPFSESTLMGPLISEQSIQDYFSAIEAAVSQGGEIVCGNKRVDGVGNFVEPTIIRMPAQTEQVNHETFAPILYVLAYDTLDEAIGIQNGVAQGLSSSIFTSSLMNSERFLSATGSDCGIANVNIGTSGAEIGGAFGGEKDTGGGRESGSDSWQWYMRRQTNTINWSSELPLAQGIEFG